MFRIINGRMMMDYFKTWDVVRILRLVFGVVVAVQGFYAGEWGIVLLGGFFSLMPLLHLGCGTGTCHRPRRRHSSVEKEDAVTYEEVK